MNTRSAIDLANKHKNVCELILLDGSKFSSYKTYFNSISEFANLPGKNDYEFIITDIFSYMFFFNIFNVNKIRIVERAIKIKELYSLSLRRNKIWYNSHYVENSLKNLNLPLPAL